jgi:hypothetical protein
VNKFTRRTTEAYSTTYIELDLHIRSWLISPHSCLEGFLMILDRSQNVEPRALSFLLLKISIVNRVQDSSILL